MPHSPIHLRSVAMLLAVTSLCAWIRPAHADITAASGAITEISHPTGTLNSNTLQSDTTAYVWFERQVTLTGSQNMDHVGPGTVNSAGSANAQTVNPGFALSYVVHFDQDNTVGTGGVTLSNLTITFERTIIGIWHTAGSLGTSDGTFAPSNLTYGTLNARGYELGTASNRDRYSISSDGRTLTIIQTRSSGSGVDQLRVLVNPEPGTGALVGIGILGLVGRVVGRRRRRRLRRQRPRSPLCGGPFLLDSDASVDDEPIRGEPGGTSFAGSLS